MRMFKQFAFAGLAMAIATPSFAGDPERPFYADGDAQAQYLNGKLEGSRLKDNDVMRFVGNVFNFNDLNPTESETAWKRAADAAILFARTAPMGYAKLDCASSATIGGLVKLTHAGSRETKATLSATGDFSKRLQTMGAGKTSVPACNSGVL